MRYSARGGVWTRPGHDILPPSTDPGWAEGWGVPTWRDEFELPTIDTTKWTVRDDSTHGNLSYDWGVISSANAFVSGDELTLRISQRSSAAVTSDGRTRWFDTAYLDTIGKLEAQYGRWEMRAQIPTVALHSKGVWPAFWLRNADVGEIDIMESWGDPPDRARSASLTETSSYTLHESTSAALRKQGWTIEAQIPSLTVPHNTASGFHTWTLERTPTYQRLLFDGIEAITVTPASHPWVWGSTFTNAPWAIRLNAQMGDPYWTQAPVPDAGRTMPADFVIDYIRYWALPA